MDKNDFIDFDIIRSSLTFENPQLFSSYLRDVYSDLSERPGSDKKMGISKLNFLDYIKIPVFISDKLFYSLDKNSDDFLDFKEFHNLYKLYLGTFEETAGMIFDIYDYNKDGSINVGDVKVLLSYLPLKKDEDKLDNKLQMESLDELDHILKLSFEKNDKMDLKRFMDVIETKKSDIYLQLLCFLYHKKPFNDQNINMYKFVRRRSSNEPSVKMSLKINTSLSPQKTKSEKVKRLPSPCKKSIFSPTEHYLKIINMKSVLKSSSPEKTQNVFNLKITTTKFTNSPTKSKAEEKSPVIVKKKSMDISNREMIRMNNKTVLPKSTSTGTVPPGETENLNTLIGKSKNFFRSPTIFFQQDDPNVDEFKEDFESGVQISEENQVHYEDWIYVTLEINAAKLKRLYMILLGKSLTLYTSKTKEEIVYFYNLSGCFVKDEGSKTFEKEKYFQFSVVLPQASNAKAFFSSVEEAKDEWILNIKDSIGYQNFKDHYDIDCDIGEGRFGAVKLGYHKRSGEKVAVKIIKKEMLDAKEFELVRTEIDLMKLFKHPNIVKLYDHFENSEYIYIVMEYLDGGHLINYLEAKQFKLTEKQAAKIIQSTALGVKYLNSYGVLHRDLKPENIMLGNKGSVTDVKIIDFGLTKTIAPGERLDDGFGTIYYVAPEVLTRKPYNKQIDIWSIGVILYILLCGTFPFDDENGNETVIAKKVVYQDVVFPADLFSNRSKEVKSLIEKCLLKDPEKRINIDKLLSDEWIKTNTK